LHLLLYSLQVHLQLLVAFLTPVYVCMTCHMAYDIGGIAIVTVIH
jgi:hypothetical protein